MQLLFLFICISSNCVGMDSALTLAPCGSKVSTVFVQKHDSYDVCSGIALELKFKGENPYCVKEIPWCRYKKKPQSMKAHYDDQTLSRVLIQSIAMNKLAYVAEMLHKSPQLVPCALHVVIKNGHYDFIENILAHHGGCSNALTDNGNRLLHMVDNSEIAQLLLRYGACVEKKNKAGETPFFKAIKQSYLNVASVLLKAGADIDEADGNNNSPLQHAVMNMDDTKIIKFLLCHGADYNRLNKQGATPYHMALQKGGAVLQAFEECKKLFLAINATVNNNKHWTVMNLLADDGRQLKDLLKCDSSGYCSADIVIAEKLLQQCSDDVLTELDYDYSPYSKELIWLAKLIKERSNNYDLFLKSLCRNNFFIARQLVEINPYLLHTYHGEYPSDEVSNMLADKLLSLFSYSPDYRHLSFLLHQCFDIYRCDNQRKILLYQLLMDGWRCAKQYINVLKIGFNVNVVDENGRTPLAHAVLSGNEERIEKLLHYGAIVQGWMLNKGKTLSLNHLLCKEFGKQRCCKCDDHPDDMFAIPCINRHSGYFICKDCYDESQGKCPRCKKTLEPIDYATHDYVRILLHNKHVEEDTCIVCFEYSSGMSVIPCGSSHPHDRVCEDCCTLLTKCPLCSGKLGEYPQSVEKGSSL